MSHSSGGAASSSLLVVHLSIYLVPIFLALLFFAFALCALFAASLCESMLNSTWNILYDYSSTGGAGAGAAPKKTFIYVVRLGYLYRSSTIDFGKTHLALVLLGVDDLCQTAFRVPWTFLNATRGGNVHSKTEQDGGTLKFLLIRDRPLMHLEKIAVTHDHLEAQMVCVSFKCLL